MASEPALYDRFSLDLGDLVCYDSNCYAARFRPRYRVHPPASRPAIRTTRYGSMCSLALDRRNRTMSMHPLPSLQNPAHAPHSPVVAQIYVTDGRELEALVGSGPAANGRPIPSPGITAMSRVCMWGEGQASVRGRDDDREGRQGHARNVAATPRRGVRPTNRAGSRIRTAKRRR